MKTLVLNLTQNKEEKFIEDVFLPLTFNSKFSQKLKDDVAFLESEGKILITTDSVNEGVHYKIGAKPYNIGYKLLARNLSDLASKGAEPIGYVLSIMKAKNTDTNFLTQLAVGLKTLSSQFKFPLIGGDISSTKSNFFSANITIFGKIANKIPSRFNAKTDEKIYITGKLGRAFLGFKGEESYISFYETPTPKVILMKKLYSKYKISAGIDVSDGLIKDLSSLLLASRIGAEIDIAKIPVPISKYKIEELISFGDDYEVIFTSPNEIKEKDVSKIGVTTSGSKLKILGLDKISNFGYSQF